MAKIRGRQNFGPNMNHGNFTLALSVTDGIVELFFEFPSRIKFFVLLNFDSFILNLSIYKFYIFSKLVVLSDLDLLANVNPTNLFGVG